MLQTESSTCLVIEMSTRFIRKGCLVQGKPGSMSWNHGYLLISVEFHSSLWQSQKERQKMKEQFTDLNQRQTLPMSEYCLSTLYKHCHNHHTYWECWPICLSIASKQQNSLKKKKKQSKNQVFCIQFLVLFDVGFRNLSIQLSLIIDRQKLSIYFPLNIKTLFLVMYKINTSLLMFSIDYCGF